MSAEFVELGRRAVACKGWRWMPGMVYLVEGPAKWRIQSNNHAVQIHADRNPDLSDPATLGCLLALVREAWGHPDLHIRREADGWRAWTDDPGGWTYGNEAAALVYTLEAAP